MSCKYSIELREIISDPYFRLFDFDYEFYTDDTLLKKRFEDKFINHYLFYEIGFETVARFKHQLKSRLDEIGCYYKQLYETQVRSAGIDFMLNKDLREEFIREVQEDSEATSERTSKNSQSSTNETDSKVSTLDNGLASVSLSAGYLTAVSKDSGKAGLSSTGSGVTDQSSSKKQVEKTLFTSSGNIGQTSSAELLEKWRGILINIDLMIIEEVRDLFMLVY